MHEVNLVGGMMLLTHGEDDCVGRHCSIHNPSDHHMVTWKQHWRGDRGLMERICPDGIGHPDPDDIAYRKLIGRLNAADIHGCDGCCAPPLDWSRRDRVA